MFPSHFSNEHPLLSKFHMRYRSPRKTNYWMARSSFHRITIILQTICRFSSPGCSLRTKSINGSPSQLSSVSCNFSKSLSASLLTYHLICCPRMTPSISACLLLVFAYRLDIVYLYFLRRRILCFYGASSGLPPMQHISA